MKKFLKGIGLIFLVILGLSIILVVLIIFSAFSSENNRSTGSNSGNIIVESEGNGKLPGFEENTPIYADSMEEALAVVNPDIYFGEDTYIDQVSYIIKVFENNNNSAMFYLSDKNSKEGAFVAAKFSIKTVNTKKQYALIDIIRQGYGNSKKREVSPEKTLSIFCQYIQVFDMANLSNLGIEEGNRFIFGGIDTVDVNKLKIEGQSPTEVIEFPLYGEKNYFWYYKNLISDKPSSEFNIEIEEK